MFGLAIAAMVASVAMIACSKDDAPAPQEEPEFYTVQLGWGGEIVDIAYEPLGTRAAGNDLYGIQVYSKPNNNSTATSWEPYAYGAFDDPTDISIDLASGNKYKFVATMVVDGMERVEWSHTEAHADCLWILSDEIGVFKEGHGAQLHTGWYHPTNSEENLQFLDYTNLDRYYGELEDFVPSSSNSDATITMKRTSFGAKFVAEGALAKSGTLMIDRMPLVLTEGEDFISDIFTLRGVRDAWKYDGINNGPEDYSDGYYETNDISFKWIRPDGTELQIGTFPITFKRNTTTVVTIKMENDVVEGDQTGGVGFSIASSETGEMPVDPNNSVTIVDGEVETGE